LTMLALLLVAGCAQPSQPESAPVTGTPSADKVPDFVPSDHWQVTVRKKSAAVASSSRDAAILFGCPDGMSSVTLIVTLETKLPVQPGISTVTMTLDGDQSLQQPWFATDESYGLTQEQDNFSIVIDRMKAAHERVEFVLSASGKELDRHTFAMKGAADAINQVLAMCAKP
jgi:hypothetical protein